jgi:hypothetical protein
MTDEAPKKAWARCPACSTVYPNIQIAKDGHKLNCPHDMQLRMDRQDERIASLQQRVLDLGGNLEDISAEPSIDFDGVEDDVEDDEPAQPSQYAEEDVASTVNLSDEDELDDALPSTPYGVR